MQNLIVLSSIKIRDKYSYSFFFISACFGPIFATIFRLTKNEGNNGLYDLLELPHHITGTVQNSFTGIVRSLGTSGPFRKIDKGYRSHSP